MSSKPPDDGFDIDNFEYSEYASTHPLSSANTDNEIESENSWTPTRRYKKRNASGYPF